METIKEPKLKEKIDLSEPKKDLKKTVAKARGKKKDAFSIHFMRLLDLGTNSKPELQKKLRVLPAEFEQKLKELYDKNYIGFDDHDQNIIWKTIKGFNEFPPKEKREKTPAPIHSKQTEAKGLKTEDIKIEPQIENMMNLEKKFADAINAGAEPAQSREKEAPTLKDLFAKRSEINVERELKKVGENRFNQADANAPQLEQDSEAEIIKYFESREGEIGRLEELIKKGAPKQGQILPKLKQFSDKLLDLEERLQRDSPQNTPGQTRIIPPNGNGGNNANIVKQDKPASNPPQLQSPQTQIKAQIAIQKQQINAIQSSQQQQAEPAAANGGEKCELCKSAFKLSMSSSEGDMAKFGHCFCGAAYHKDCYEHLLTTEKRCLRCSSELKLQMDQKSKEALSKIKQMF